MSKPPVLPDEIAQAIVDPYTYADVPKLDATFRWIRREMPLAVAKPNGFHPFWVVSRHADISDISRRNDEFLNGRRQAVLISSEAEALTTKATGGKSNYMFRAITRMDGPSHMAHRRLAYAWFSPAGISALSAQIRVTAAGFVDRMLAHGGECDFVSDVALRYPLHIIMGILGVPEEDEPIMLKLTQELFGNQDPEINKKEAGLNSAERLVATAAEFSRYFSRITADRRANPREDLATVIANGRVDGEYLHPLAELGYYIITATAGHDTTSHTISESAIALATHPDLWPRLRQDPGSLKGFIEESTRIASPVKHFMRTAAADSTVAGQNIAADDWLMLCYHSGNRDEAVFDDPLRFDIDRKTRQVAFGYGGHMCLGQHLARLEMQIFWEEFLKRVESMELRSAPRRVIANFVTGPKSVPVRFTARAQ